MKKRTLYLLVAITSILMVFGCAKNKNERAEALYKSYCASCHILPNIQDLPKAIWAQGVLPDMAARMGIRDSTTDPYKGISRREQLAMMKSGIYPAVPTIKTEDWELLRDYIIAMAPESLTMANNTGLKEMTLFSPEPIALDSTLGSFITFLGFNREMKQIAAADLNGSLIHYNAQHNRRTVSQTGPGLTSIITKNHLDYHTTVGILNPSEQVRGTLTVTDTHNNVLYSAPEQLHRPVHTLVADLNQNGNDEIIICEFGHLTGKVTLLHHSGDFHYHKETLLDLPGGIRAIARDMNGDQKTDLVVLMGQGKEGVFIFYQENDLKFKVDNPIKFSPVYGTSWLDLVDVNLDGYMDIVTVHGDNADKSYVHKPYHGLRIHMNDGHNNFNETYFYPMNGATRFVSEDFDQDGDIDFAVISTFPNYDLDPYTSFVYMENTNSKTLEFNFYTSKAAKLGRWLLMDSGDFDSDGDIDIVLSSFTYSFTPVPKDLQQFWQTSNTDLLWLKNTLVP